MRLKVLIAAGGSGGHLFPAQQLRDLLKRDSDVIFAGHKLSESPFFEKEKIPFREIAAAAPKRGHWFRFFTCGWRGFWQGISLLMKEKPDVVVGFGSYHTFPILLAAAAMRKKIVLFEANCILGKVNRLFLPFTRKIALQFPLSDRFGKEAFVPYLPWGSAPKERAGKEAARIRFGLDPKKLTVLVFGGSQGAAFLNDAVPKALSLLKGIEIQAIHFTGKGTARYGQIQSCVKEFEKEMHLAYAAADFAICRSGAGTTAELIRSELPALLIPFPFAADNHQWKNGEFLSKRVGGARLLSQRAASPEKIAEEIGMLLKEREALRSMLRMWNRSIESRSDFGELVREIGRSK